MKKKVLVCGASGFIGRNIFEYLSKDPDIDLTGTYGTKRFSNTHRLVKADLTCKRDVDLLLGLGFDVVIQAAATTSGSKTIREHPEIHITDNAMMNSLIFRSAHHHNIPHVIFFSCTIMYEFGHRPLKETDIDLNREFGDYFAAGWTKIYLEKQCEFFSRLGKTRFTVVRHSNIYGPHDKFDLERSHVFGAAINKVINSDNGQVVIWGEGTEKRDLLHVDDLCEFIELAMKKQQSHFEIFNVGLGETISIKKLYEKIIKHSGKDLKLIHDLSRPTIKDSSITIDIKRALEFGWQPKTSLDAGIVKTIDWYRHNKEHQ